MMGSCRSDCVFALVVNQVVWSTESARIFDIISIYFYCLSLPVLARVCLESAFSFLCVCWTFRTELMTFLV